MRALKHSGLMLGELITGVLPPEQVQVSEAAERHLRGKDGAWVRGVAPYMIEPMDMLAGPEARLHDGVVFCGPARSSKSFSLVMGWLSYIMRYEPATTAVYLATEGNARDFSNDDFDPAMRASPDLRERLIIGKKDNTFDKQLKDGTTLYFRWPSEAQLAARTIKNIMLSDYDRIKGGVGQQGNAFDVARKRNATYLSAGMAIAESNCGFEQIEGDWLVPADRPHEAPGVAGGVLQLFNRGDRRRLYWRCPHCGEFYMQPPGIEGFTYDVEQDDLGHVLPETVKNIGLICQTTGCFIEIEQKRNLLAPNNHLWVPEGCEIINRKGKPPELAGMPRQTSLVSYWLPGAAAAYQPIDDLVRGYLAALREYETLGDEDSLRKVSFSDLNVPYLPMIKRRSGDRQILENRAESYHDDIKRAVPAGVRFLIAAVDVQKERWVVQILGFGVNLECWLVDRFDVRWSKRRYASEAAPVNPGARIEDWDLLREKAIHRSYPLADDSGRRMRVMLTVCDSGGRAGVTPRAYQFWRKLRDEGKGDHEKFLLVKGDPGEKPLVTLSWPDSSERKDRAANARGEIPLFLLNSNLGKDALNVDLAREDIGGGYIHFPDWLGQWFYRELDAEVRNDKGKWEKSNRGRPNEAIDLFVYARAGIRIKLILDYQYNQRRAPKGIDWKRTPLWANPHEQNPLVSVDTGAKVSKEGSGPSEKDQKGATPVPPALGPAAGGIAWG